MGLQGWPLMFVRHFTDATGVPPACPPGCSPLHLLHLSSLSIIIGMPNWSCILKLRSNQCIVCNFLGMPRCQCQIAPRKTPKLRRGKPQNLSCLAYVDPFKIACDSSESE